MSEQLPEQSEQALGTICQFFLRGRCQRENCEFKHQKPEKSITEPVKKPVEKSQESDTAASGIPAVARKVK